MQKHELRPFPGIPDVPTWKHSEWSMYYLDKSDALEGRLRLAVELLREAAWDGIIPVKWHDKYARLLASLPEDMR